MNKDAFERERGLLPPKLTLGQVVPSFDLPDSSGRRVALRDYKGRRNLVLYFFHGSRCADCRDVLTAFASRYQSYRDLDAQVLAISHDPLPVVRALAEGLRLPFPVLSDPAAEVTRRYIDLPAGNGTVAAIFVTDRYGALYHQTIAERDGELPGQEQILQWLQFIGIQCEECGVPEWPAG